MEIKKIGCTTCQKKAVLEVGDLICHRMQANGKKIDCHALAHDVQSGRKTVEDYVDELERNASEKEKSYIEQLRGMF